MRRSVDEVSLTAGIGTILLGLVLLGDQADAFELSLGWLGACLAAAVGAVLLISGVRDRAPVADQSEGSSVR